MASISSLRGSLIGIDTETTGLNPWNSECFRIHSMEPCRPFSVGLVDKLGTKVEYRWEVIPKTRQVVVPRKDVRELNEVLGDPSVTKVGHNILFDIRMLIKSSIKFNWTRIHDTYIMAHVLTGGAMLSYSAKDLAREWLGMSNEDEKRLEDAAKSERMKAKAKGWAVALPETHGEKPYKSDYWIVSPRSLLTEYLFNDLDRTMMLYLGMVEKFKEEPKLWAIYNGTEIPLLKEVYRMEAKGIRVLPNKVKYLEKIYTDYNKEWTAKAEKLGGKGMNFNSPKQLVQKFCVELGHKVKKTTDAGNPSIGADELSRMAVKYPLAKAILECRASEAMITKFLASYKKFMCRENGLFIIHPGFNQCGARTTRFSSSNPNFQQVGSPDSVKKKADIALRPREAFGPLPGHYWLMPDYSQMEVWVFAFQAKDPILTKALLAGEDVHEAIGKMMWGHTAEWKPGKTIHRKKGKTIMFLKQYGGGASAYMEFMGCSKSEAYHDLDGFDDRFPGVNKFIEATTQRIKEDGYIEDCFGRQYYIDAGFEYKGVNYLIQGTCAGMMKRAMKRLGPVLRRKFGKMVSIVLTVHDELAIQASNKVDVKELSNLVRNNMQVDSQKVGIPVPIPVSMKATSTTWADAKEF